MDSRLQAVLVKENEIAEARSATLVAAPIEVRSALDRRSKIVVSSTVVPVKKVDWEPESDTDDDEAPEWPAPDVEDAMQVELAGKDRADTDRGNQPRKSSRSKDATLEGGPLPALDELVAKIPTELRATLEELYRAQFDSVRRVPSAVLKPKSKAATGERG